MLRPFPVPIVSHDDPFHPGINVFVEGLIALHASPCDTTTTFLFGFDLRLEVRRLPGVLSPRLSPPETGMHPAHTKLATTLSIHYFSITLSV